ncbi:LysR family transcriptional regulator [Catellatospora coxensis]|uniref:LysR family transcriptional regulator n=1 Tax=Catellatospora coxensis TaxID=310354 RepID=A0A8J3P4P3_9ACTN|nr:LysR family transcriptional regulator [Catellatospora coxensis]GIG03557.1 LysR family transcriptional regulator [Catellatospora coxensis]
MLDLGRLRAIDALSRHGTVHAAAAALHCTPSAVSQQLAKLERETGAVLCHKDGRGLRLSDAGRLLAEHAALVLAAADTASAALDAYRGEVAGEVTVACFATACRGLLPPALTALTTSYPRLRPRVVETNPYEALQALDRGRVDVAVIDDWREVRLHLPPGVSSTVLGEDTADLVVPADHPLATAGPGPLDRAANERWIASPEGTICHDWLVRALPGLRPAYLVGEFETQQALVAAGLGVALLPRLARLTTAPGTVVVPVDPVPTRRVSVTWRTAHHQRPALKAVIEAVTTAWSTRTTARAGS